MGPSGRRGAREVTGDHPHRDASPVELHLGHIRREDILVARRDHLRRSGQVDPHLEPVEPTAVGPDLGRGHLRVHDTGARGLLGQPHMERRLPRPRFSRDGAAMHRHDGPRDRETPEPAQPKDEFVLKYRKP